ALGHDLRFGLHYPADLGKEPWIDLARDVDLLVADAKAHGLRNLQNTIGRRRAERRANGVLVVALAEALDGDFVEAGESGLERTQGLLQGFLEGAPDRHRFTDRLHRSGKVRFGTREFLERETWNLGDDIIDRRLERSGRRAASDVVGDLVQRVADGK